MLEDKKGKLMSKNQGEISTIDINHSPVQMNGRTFSKIVRHSKCQMLVSELKESVQLVWYTVAAWDEYIIGDQRRSFLRVVEKVQIVIQLTFVAWIPLKNVDVTVIYIAYCCRPTEKEAEKLQQVIEASNEKHGVKVGESGHADLSNNYYNGGNEWWNFRELPCRLI